MKRLACALKVGAVFLLTAGLLFSSCTPLADGNYGSQGTLMITLPGGSASGLQTASRAAVSNEFTATLAYDIECTGPAGLVTRRVLPGAVVSIPLNPGDWTVTVTVLNAAGRKIGSTAVPATIESGKTTSLQIPVNIDTTGNDITHFAITWPGSGNAKINSVDHTIEVQVRTDADLTAMFFMVTHTGRSINPGPEAGPLDFSSSQTFTVTAENGDMQTWTVTVDPSLSPPQGTGTWPDTAAFGRYGLAGLTQPPGTTVSLVAESSDQYTGQLTIQLENAGKTTAYDALIARIEQLTGGEGSEDGSDEAGVYYYTLTYAHLDMNFDIFIILGMTGQTSSPGTLTLTVTNNTQGNPSWPADTKWAAFGLSGLTQPDGTGIIEVAELSSPYPLLTVRLRLTTAGDTVYEDIYDQLCRILNSNPIPLEPDPEDPQDQHRAAVFMITGGSGMLMVDLLMETADNEISITATKMSG
jgi:hypothetical protein